MVFDYVSVSDDLGFRDPFCILALLATETNRVKLNLTTNPYSRNPALIARAAATIDEISNGRVVLNLGAGGSLTLPHLGIPMWDRPVRAVREAIEVCRRLIRGETVDYEGQTFKLRGAKLLFTPKRNTIPIYMAARGPQMLRLAGMMADGVVLAVDPYFDFAVNQIRKGAERAGRPMEEIRLCSEVGFVTATKEEFIRYLHWEVANSIMDTPLNVLEMAHIESRTMETIRRIKGCRDADEAAELVTDDVANLYRIVNTPDALVERARELVKKGVKEIHIIPAPGTEDRVLPIVGDEVIPVLKAL